MCYVELMQNDTCLSLCRCLCFCFHRLLGLAPGSFVFQGCIALPHGPQERVPECEEWLGEVRLDAPALMVNVVVSCIVTGDVLNRVPG